MRSGDGSRKKRTSPLVGASTVFAYVHEIIITCAEVGLFIALAASRHSSVRTRRNLSYWKAIATNRSERRPRPGRGVLRLTIVPVVGM